MPASSINHKSISSIIVDIKRVSSPPNKNEKRPRVPSFQRDICTSFLGETWMNDANRWIFVKKTMLRCIIKANNSPSSALFHALDRCNAHRSVRLVPQGAGPAYRTGKLAHDLVPHHYSLNLYAIYCCNADRKSWRHHPPCH